MSVEFTFMAGARSNVPSASPGASFFFDPRKAASGLTVVEDAGFQGVVIDDPAGLLANFDLAADAAAVTSSLQLVLTHWAGFVAPTVAARQVALLDAGCGGRLVLRILGEGAEDPQASHVETWQRTDEYLTLLKRLWSNDLAFDHEGPFYSIRHGLVAEKGPRRFGVPIRMGGLSGTALRVAARHADIFELAPGTPEETRVLMERVRAAAAQFGRAERIRFALPVGFAPERFDAMASRMLDHARVGVSEFMISGIDGPEAIRAFGTKMRALLGTADDGAEPGDLPGRRKRHFTPAYQ